MKTLISGIIGAAAAAVAWLAMEHQMQQDFPWMASLVGLITGIAVRAGAEAGTGESYGRGAMAAILALAACVGGRLGYVEYMKSVNEGADKPQLRQEVAQVDEGDDEEAEVDPNAEGADEPVVVDRVRSELDTQTDGLKIAKPSIKKSMSEWDMIWLGGSALLAYIVGKGGSGQPTQVAEDQPEGSEPENSEQGES